MSDLENAINQAISDFDDIEAAIEEKGVEVAEGTDTSEYGNLIRSIPQSGGVVDQNYNPLSGNAQSGYAVAEALAGLPIKYVESLDTSNPLYLRDLESGTYILYGKFRPFNGSTNTCTFSSGMLVSVIRNTSISYMQIFYAKNNTIQYCTITDDTYTRDDAKLVDMETKANLTTVIDYVGGGADDEHYPSARAVEYALQSLRTDFSSVISAVGELVANTLKATASGKVIRVDDVSPLEHTAKVKVESVNMIPYPFYNNTKVMNGITFTDNGDGSVTAKGTCEGGNAVFYFVNGHINRLYGNVTITGCPEGGSPSTGGYSIRLNKIVNGKDVSGGIDAGNGATVNVDGCEGIKLYLVVLTGGTVDITVKPMLNRGDTPLEYEPYINPETVTVTRCGKNLLNFAPYTTNGEGTTTVTFDAPILTAGATLYAHGITKSGKALATGNCAIVFRKGSTQLLNTSPNLPIIVTKELTETDTFAIYTNANIAGETVDSFQLEVGNSATDYEEYKVPQIYTLDACGEFMIPSLSPTMTLFTDTDGANIELEYNQDTNKAMSNVKEDITTLDNDMAELKGSMGDIETALDGIITIQNELIGGDSV